MRPTSTAVVAFCPNTTVEPHPPLNIRSWPCRRIVVQLQNKWIQFFCPFTADSAHKERGRTFVCMCVCARARACVDFIAQHSNTHCSHCKQSWRVTHPQPHCTSHTTSCSSPTPTTPQNHSRNKLPTQLRARNVVCVGYPATVRRM